MRITQWGEYGVHCCVFLATKKAMGIDAVSASEIAESQMIDLQYAQQILQRLRRNDIVQSIRGPQGGYKLSKPANEITLHDILRAAEGETFEIICENKPLNDERCAEGVNCSLRPIWYKLRTHVDSFLSSITVEQLANQTPANDQCVQIGKEVASP